jgi:hypothetical protein
MRWGDLVDIIVSITSYREREEMSDLPEIVRCVRYSTITSEARLKRFSSSSSDVSPVIGALFVVPAEIESDFTARISLCVSRFSRTSIVAVDESILEIAGCNVCFVVVLVMSYEGCLGSKKVKLFSCASPVSAETR